MKRYIKSNFEHTYSFDVVVWKTPHNDIADLRETFNTFRDALDYAYRNSDYYRCDIYKMPDNVRMCQYSYGHEVLRDRYIH